MVDLLIGRKFFGLGDWIMLMSALRAFMLQYPHLRIHLDVTDAPADYANFPAWFEVPVVPVRNPRLSEYRTVIAHLVYPSPTDSSAHYIQGMLTQLSTRIAPLLATESTAAYAKCMLSQAYMPQIPTSDYILMPSIGKTDTELSASKNMTLDYMQTLAEALSRRYKIIQVGSADATDPALTYRAGYAFGLALPKLARLIERSAGVVALENGLAHFAGHQYKDTCVLHSSRTQVPVKPSNVHYMRHTHVLNADLLDPVDVAERIISVFEGKLVPAYAIGKEYGNIEEKSGAGGT